MNTPAARTRCQPRRSLAILLMAALLVMLPGCRLAQAVLPFFLMDQAPPKTKQAGEENRLAGSRPVQRDPDLIAAAGGSR